LEDWENANLAATAPAKGRGARWPLSARWRGRLRRTVRRASALPGPGDPASGVIVPEIFSPAVAASLPALFAASDGPRVAVFHDLIALRLPEMTPGPTVGRFPAYLRELLLFDAVAAVSEDSRDALVEYWRWLGVAHTPPVAAISLGLDPPSPPPPPPAPAAVATILSVGSIEARKNHAALLDACEALWARGVRFDLRLIGLANADTGGPAVERIRRLSAAGRPVRFDGAQDDDALEAAYAACAFTVYPSLSEGFGLPVAESLLRGKPCLCRAAGALGEVSRGGGCLDIGLARSEDIAAAIDRLLRNPAELAALAASARARTFKTWSAYTSELLGWMGTIKRLT
jgi:glycosyltransferase involved in cell wall biosynthesis